MQPFVFWDGESFGTSVTVVFAHPSSAVGCSVSFPAPSCQETSVLFPACSSLARWPCQNSPAKTTFQIPPAVRPKPSVSFSPGAEHPHACLPSPGVLPSRHPTLGAAALPARLVPALPARPLQPFPGSSGRQGERLPCAEPFLGGLAGFVPPAVPELGWRDWTPAVCAGTTSGAAIPAHGDAGAARWGLACALPAAPRLPPASPRLLRSVPSARHVINLSAGKLLSFFFAIQGNWHLLMCLGSLFLSAFCTLTHLHSASLSQRLSDLLLFYYYLDARCKGND